MLRGSPSVCSVTYVQIHSAHLEPSFSSWPIKTFKYHLCCATKDITWPIEITQRENKPVWTNVFIAVSNAITRRVQMTNRISRLTRHMRTGKSNTRHKYNKHGNAHLCITFYRELYRMISSTLLKCSLIKVQLRLPECCVRIQLKLKSEKRRMVWKPDSSLGMHSKSIPRPTPKRSWFLCSSIIQSAKAHL